jgi:hypothetical protein
MRAVVRPKVVTVGGTSEHQLPVLAAGRSRIVSARERLVQGLRVVRAGGARYGACDLRAALDRAYVPSSDGVGAMLAVSLYAAVDVAILVVVNRVEGDGVHRGGANLLLALVDSDRS